MDFKEALVKRREAKGRGKKVPYHVQRRLEREEQQKDENSG